MSRVVHTNIWSAYGYARKAGYEGTEEEFEQGLKKSAEAAGNAEESAYTASEAAAEANAARDAAAQSAESASTSEGNALEYANSAAQVLRDAQAVAQTVNAKANEAAGSASRAENYAQTATTKASEATTAAGTATAAATSASGSAQEADASATAAAASETNAAASASSASTSAGNASESADDAAESAAAAQAVKDSIPEDYTALSDEVTDLKSQITDENKQTEIVQGLLSEQSEINLLNTSNNYNLNEDGYRVFDTAYMLKKYVVHAGAMVHVTTNGLWQFQNSNSVPAAGEESTRIGLTYKYTTAIIQVPDGATHLILAVLKTATDYNVSYATPINVLYDEIISEKIISKAHIVQGSYSIVGTVSNYPNRLRTNGYIKVNTGDKITFTPGENTKAIFYGKFDKDKIFLHDGVWVTGGEISIDWDGYTILVYRGDTTNSPISPENYDGITKIIPLEDVIIDQRITAIESGDYNVPEYWKNNLAIKNQEIITNMGTAGMNGETFIFLTDIHWPTNHKQSPALVKNIVATTGVDQIILGGDALVIHATKIDAINEGIEVINAFKNDKARLYNTFGNHDANFNVKNGIVNTDAHLSYGEVYSSQFAFMDYYDIHYLNAGVDFSYYFDKPISKTRFIILDSGEGFLASGVSDPDNIVRQDFASYDQLHSTLMSTPEGWHVIVICHIETNKPFYNIYALLEGNNRKGNANIMDGATIVKSYSFANAPAYVEIAIGGHGHYDISGGQDANRYVPWVIVDCDCWDIKKVYTDENGNTIDRTGQVVAGTTTEQAFDVITVDYTNRVAKMVRIGTRGQNRTIPLK